MAFFLLESGDHLLLESGDSLLLEDEPVPPPAPTLTSADPSIVQFEHTGHSFTVSVALLGTAFDGDNPVVNVPAGWDTDNLVVIDSEHATVDITVPGDADAGFYPITFETDDGESESVDIYVNLAILYQPDIPRLLLRGFAGKLLAEVTVVDVDEEGAYSGVIDASRCAQMAVQITSQSEDEEPFTAQLEQTFDGVNWEAVGSPFTAVGESLKLDCTDGPFGVLRLHLELDPASSASSTSDFVGTTVSATFVGWELQKEHGV